MPAAVDGDAAVAAAEPLVIPEYQAACEPFVVVGQDLELEVNFLEKTVSGISTLLIFPLVDGLEELSIDARQCHIDTENIRVDGVRTKASYNDPYDLLTIPDEWQLGATQHHVMMKRMAPLLPESRPDVPISQREDLMEHALGCVPNEGSLKISLRPGDLAKDEPARAVKIKPETAVTEEERAGIKISIPFRSKNVCDGLHFVGVDEGDKRYPHVYTRHSVDPGTASCIFPCIDDPGQRHLFKVSIKCPRTLGDTLEQPLATQQQPQQVSSSVSSMNGSSKRKHSESGPLPQPPQTVLVEEDKLTEMTVICSGNLIGEQVDPDDDRKKIMSFECQNAAAHHIGFAVGPFEHVALWAEFRTEESDEKLGANAAKVHGYCLPGRTEEMQHTCAPIVAAADMFALEFGRYPFDSYKVCFVEDMVTDTAEAASLSLCSTRLLYPPDIIDTDIEVTRKLVHSLASQYLGMHIVPNRRSDRWLVIGIQWYMTDLYMKTLCGTNWYKFHTKTMSDKLVELDVGRPSLHDLGERLHMDFEAEFMALKAPLVLFILDQRMSKYPGSIGVARVVSQFVSTANISNTEAKATSISAEDFRRVGEKKSQYRPEEFWDQWIHSAGCPRILIRQKFNKKNLNVEIAATQVQRHPAFVRAKDLSKDDFWREFQEEIHAVYASEVPKLFTGPFTIRIHEADGTPYEHYLDIREDDRAGTTWIIPYNTKYKRLKRKGRQRDQVNAAAANIDGKNDSQDDDVVYFNMLGDVLSTDDDYKNWGLQDWDAEIQNAMNQESYEWIRFDCNFEWICDIATDMPGYMYLAQLQQDRDVVAHQDSMLFWMRSQKHPVISTIEVRTLFDRRYYVGIRLMALQDLPKQATPEQNYIGMAHLILVFRHFFCYRVVDKAGNETWPPAPNDFSDRPQYAVQCAIPGAIASIRGENGRCPRTARAFLLDLLLFNDNSNNEFSDQFYVVSLLKALTTSLINDKYEEDRELIFTLKMDDDDDAEFKQFIEKTIEEIDSYRRMDEWTFSYQNIWTTTALECKMRLMKARVIPTAPLEFLQYLQDDNLDLVRIKAFECLVELGMLSRPPILRLLLSVLSTDSSPFVRDSLFRIFCRGIAAIAFGENKSIEKPVRVEKGQDNDGLIIEQGEAITEARKALAARKKDINAALAGLKDDVRGNMELQMDIWRAFQSPSLGLREKQRILELCQALFEPEDTLLMTFKYPRVWKATRVTNVSNGNCSSDKQKQKGCIVNFTAHYRTKPKGASDSVITAQLSEPKKIKLQSRPSIQEPSSSISVQPPLVRQPSVSIPVSNPPSDSISVHRALPSEPLEHDTDALSLPPPAPSRPYEDDAAQPSPIAKASEKRPKPPKKRKSDETEAGERPKKIARTSSVSGEFRRKLVTLKFTRWDQLSRDVRREINAQRAQNAVGSSTIVASPAAPRTKLQSPGPSVTYSPLPSLKEPNTPAAPLPMFSTHAGEGHPGGKPRKPLPSSAPHAPQPTTPTSTSTAAEAGAGGVASAQGTPAPAPSQSTTTEAQPTVAKPKTVIKLKLPSLKSD
ncbi:hypothetical protein VTK73DRAFT_7685 [Phialemonium thermophilum]|uniref:Transcription initiation factor TFIID subunit 2 n=1 Tax=Phialemonium thermophilum TaxID=223376 RepID=A0ABR3XRJ9_9PEZI